MDTIHYSHECRIKWPSDVSIVSEHELKLPYDRILLLTCTVHLLVYMAHRDRKREREILQTFKFYRTTGDITVHL